DWSSECALPISTLSDPDAELLLQTHKVAAVVSGKRGQQRIAFEFERNLFARVRSGAVARVQCAATVGCAGVVCCASAPRRELGSTSMIFTLRSAPISGAAHSTCTGCR